MLYHIVAMSKNNVIGKDNKLPWHFSCDLKNFKKITMGSTVIMGRKTYASIGRPLPGRQNYVLSRSANSDTDNPKYYNNLEQAVKESPTEKTFIIGGAEIYKETLKDVDGIYLTLIDDEYEGDAFYPNVPENFKEKSKEILQAENPKIEVIYYEKESA